MLHSCRCCCCSMPLEKASRIIGLTFGILSLLALGRSVLTWLMLSPLEDSHLGDTHRRLLRRAATQLLIHICTSLALGIFSALLVLGVSRRSKCLVLSFMVYFGAVCLLSTIVLLYSLYDPSVLISEIQLREMREQNGAKMVKTIVFISVGLTLPVQLFFWYLWLVVVSYYRELTDNPPSGSAQPPPDTWVGQPPPGNWPGQQAGYQPPPGNWPGQQPPPGTWTGQPAGWQAPMV
ncbi:hypothetical protein FJT64_014723 [Amphibalanus amphitrite]|uniref:Lysosomal-associated transmembrane protein 4A n=1 Tax=Amphibalanus amphitrite TaxID=1232801 RepID=A0A6A4USY0_AMPAM|nr:hypothetical protein FJT64_014723 [Amphibalanus amphitrite]